MSTVAAIHAATAADSPFTLPPPSPAARKAKSLRPIFDNLTSATSNLDDILHDLDLSKEETESLLASRQFHTHRQLRTQLLAQQLQLAAQDHAQFALHRLVALSESSHPAVARLAATQILAYAGLTPPPPTHSTLLLNPSPPTPPQSPSPSTSSPPAASKSFSPNSILFSSLLVILLAAMTTFLTCTLSRYGAPNRATDINIGTNGGVTDDSEGGLNLTTDANSDGILDVLEGSVPTRSDDVLVTSYTYNVAGELDTVTDPMGIVSKTYYDALGRVLFTVAAWDGSYDPTTGALPPSDDADQTTGYTYDGDGHTLTMTAVMPSGEDSQTTQYIYGVTTAGGSTINSNDLLALVEYPDPTTGAASTDPSNQNSFTYDALGETLTKTDQNGTTHTYTYDVLGRQTLDAVTTLGSGVDGTILSIGTTYNDQGLTDTTTSYTTTTADSDDIANQVQDIYNGLGQLIQEYQSVSGAVDTGSTPSVQYAYDTLANGSRLTSMTYPNGTMLTYSYGDLGSLNDVISRLDSLIDNGTTVESYQYLGLSTVVIESNPQDGIDMTYVKQTGEANGDAGDQYIGLDRFGRVADQRWIDSNGVDQDRYLYTYDADGNVTEKGNALNSHLTETYTYDNLNRLTSTTRDGVTYQSFGMDSVGNINSVTTSGTTTDNATNDQNELTGVGSNTLTYDNNGNTITDDQGHTLIYDAWNRLIEVKDGSTVLEAYTYDAMGRQITQTPGGGTTTALYYSSQDQVIEERQNNSATAQYVWSAVYVNAMVLRDRDADDSGDGTLEERTYATHDANFNVTSLVTQSSPGTWSVAERFVYDAYGNFTIHAANWDAATDSLNWNYTFQGMRWDSIVKMNITPNRFYSPTMMRWLQQDPMGYVDGVSRYSFVGDNVINWVDPKGTDIFIIAGGPGKVVGHQSIGIGDPSGTYVAWEFAMDGSRFGIFNPFNTDYGVVSEDTDRGGTIKQIIHTTPAQDAEATKIMNSQIGNRDAYRLTHPNCRTFAQTNWSNLKDRYTGPGAAPGIAPPSPKKSIPTAVPTTQPAPTTQSVTTKGKNP